MHTHPTVSSSSAPGRHIQASQSLSYHFAAAAIAEPEFPNERLMPRIDAVPYNNLGAMPLLDYPLLCEILWDCAAELKAAHSEAVHTRWPYSLGVVLVTFAAFLYWTFLDRGLAEIALSLFIASFFYDVSSGGGRIKRSTGLKWLYVLICLMSALLGLNIFTMIVASSSKDPYAIQFALACLTSSFAYAVMRTWFRTEALRAVKVRYIDALMKDTRPAPPEGRASRTLHPLAQASVGAGILGPDKIDVFVANGDDDLVPGLGWERVKELYVCPPKTDDTDEHAPVYDLVAQHHALASNLAAAASTLCGQGLRCSTSHGALVILDGNSLHLESVWLSEQRPLLSVAHDGNIERMLALQSSDPDAKARVFLGLQVYFPEYSTLVTLAIRVFFAASAASVQVIVASLGPPRISRRVLRKSLAWRAEQRSWWSSRTPKSHLAARLYEFGTRLTKLNDPLKVSIDGRSLTSLFDRVERQREECKEAERLVKSTDSWVGPYTRIANWREARSLAMSNEFFDAAECVASVRALYAGIVESTLASLDGQGFNVDAYRDARGKLTIKTESIGQLIVGDKIQLSQGDRRVTTPTPTPTQTPASVPTVPMGAAPSPA